MSDWESQISLLHADVKHLMKTQDNDVIDLIAVHRITGTVIKVDVKTASYRKRTGTMIFRKLSNYQKQLGVKILYVFKNGECKWKK